MDTHEDLLQTTLPVPPKAGGGRSNPARAAWDAWTSWLPVRNLQTKHRERVLTHLLSLDSHDRHLRFGQAASDDMIRSYVARINFERDEVFGIFDARLRLLAMAHLAYDGAATPDAAEFGVSVLPRGRGRGIGSRLFALAALHARNRGAKTLLIHLARENTPMLAIVRRSGATVRYEGSDATAALTLPDDSLSTHLEALAESKAADLDYRFKRQALRWRERLLGPRPGPGGS